MSIPFRSRNMQQYLMNRLAEPATLHQYVKSSVDAYGDEAYTVTSTEIQVIQSLVTNTRVPFERRGVLGHYYITQVEFFVLDDIIPPNTAVDKKPTLTYNGNEYEILETEDSKIGLIRFIAYRRRE